MTVHDNLAAVVRLACLTEDRTDGEQRALIEVAWRLDIEHNALVVTNRKRETDGWEPWDLVSLVMDTRVLGAADREVPPPKTRERRWQTWRREGAMVRS